MKGTKICVLVLSGADLKGETLLEAKLRKNFGMANLIVFTNPAEAYKFFFCSRSKFDHFSHIVAVYNYRYDAEIGTVLDLRQSATKVLALTTYGTENFPNEDFRMHDVLLNLENLDKPEFQPEWETIFGQPAKSQLPIKRLVEIAQQQYPVQVL